jgi:hypothetical protein
MISFEFWGKFLEQQSCGWYHLDIFRTFNEFVTDKKHSLGFEFSN